MTPEERKWIEELRRTKTSGNIGFGGRQMRRLLAIVDGLEAEADFLARILAASSEDYPEDQFCKGPARPGCAGLTDTNLCYVCWRAKARGTLKQEQNHDQ